MTPGDRIRLDFTTRGHRTFAERVMVRFPALARSLAYLVSRLKPGSRPRRVALARIARQTVSAANRRDWDVLLLAVDPKIDYQAIAGSTPTGWILPDFVGHHHGHAGYRRLWDMLIEGFHDLTVHCEELIDAGDRLVSTTRMRGHGLSSGLAIDQLVFQVLTLRRGLVVKQGDFADREEALEAAGLAPPSG